MEPAPGTVWSSLPSDIGQLSLIVKKSQTDRHTGENDAYPMFYILFSKYSHVWKEKDNINCSLQLRYICSNVYI